MLDVKFVKLSEDAIVPCYGRRGDAGLDLFTVEDIVIRANETIVIPTNIAIQLPMGYEASVRPRSGISLNGVKGCTDCSTMKPCQPYLRVQFGTVDSNYRGSIGIITYNQENYDVYVPRGTKLAQLVVSPVISVDLIEVESLDDTNRGNKGFGSSGI